MESWFSNFFDFYYIYYYLELFGCDSKPLPYILISTRFYLLPRKPRKPLYITSLFIQTKTLLPFC